MQAALIVRQQAGKMLTARAPGAQPVMAEAFGGPAFGAGPAAGCTTRTEGRCHGRWGPVAKVSFNYHI